MGEHTLGALTATAWGQPAIYPDWTELPSSLGSSEQPTPSPHHPHTSTHTNMAHWSAHLILKAQVHHAISLIKS